MFPTLTTKHHYALLGVLVSKHQPDVATRLLEDYYPHREALEKDLSKIDTFFERFCDLRGMAPEALHGPLYKAAKVDLRRQFISVILHLYAPNIFDQPDDCITIGKSGIAKKLSTTLAISKQSITKLIREALFFESHYTEFKQAVEEITEAIQA